MRSTIPLLSLASLGLNILSVQSAAVPNAGLARRAEEPITHVYRSDPVEKRHTYGVEALEVDGLEKRHTYGVEALEVDDLEKRHTYGVEALEVGGLEKRHTYGVDADEVGLEKRHTYGVDADEVGLEKRHTSTAVPYVGVARRAEEPIAHVYRSDPVEKRHTYGVEANEIAH